MIECYLGTKLVMEMIFDVSNSHRKLRHSKQFQVNQDMPKVNISHPNDCLNTVDASQILKVVKTVMKKLSTMSLVTLLVTAILVSMSDSGIKVLN